LNLKRFNLSIGAVVAAGLMIPAAYAFSARPLPDKDLMGRRVVTVDVTLEGAPGGDSSEMR